MVAGSAIMYSQNAPSWLKPAISLDLQYLGSASPCWRMDNLQPGHSEHAFLKFKTPTRSPTFHSLVHLAPTSTIIPAGSCDGIIGNLEPNWPCCT